MELTHKGYTIKIDRCYERGWRGYWDYSITKTGEPKKIIGRMAGLRREVVSHLKWDIGKETFTLSN